MSTDTELITVASAGDRDSRLESNKNSRDYVNECSWRGDSPIIYASGGEHVDVAELLLSKGANPYDKNKDGDSPIIYASRGGHVDAYIIGLSPSLFLS